MSEINEKREPSNLTTDKPSDEELIQRYATIHNISIEQAKEEVGAESTEQILKNIEEIREKMPVMNRAQRRALKKKYGAKKYAEMMASDVPTGHKSAGNPPQFRQENL